MSDNFDQHDAHRPTPSPSGARQDGHSGGSATSRATRSAARNPPRNCVSREGASSWLAETSSFMLQMYQMPQSPTIFDRQLLRARQQRARALGAETFLIDRVADELGERLSAVLRQFERIGRAVGDFQAGLESRAGREFAQPRLSGYFARLRRPGGAPSEPKSTVSARLRKNARRLSVRHVWQPV